MRKTNASKILSIIVSHAFIICLTHAARAQETLDNGEVVDVEQPELAENASKPARETILYIDHALGGQYGPLGVMYQLDPNYRKYFFPDSDNILLKDAYVGFGLTGALTPAFAYYGPSLTVAPLTIFKVTVEFTHYIFGVMGKKYGLLDYSPENAPPSLEGKLGQFGNYNYAFRDKHGDKIGKVEPKAWALFIKPTLLLQFGPIVLIDMANFMYYNPGNHEGPYYNDNPDIILSPKSWCILNETLVLWEIATLEKKSYALYAGLTNHMTFVLPEKGNEDMERTFRWKIGPMVAWTITDKWGDYIVEEPTILFQLHYVIKDPIDADHKRIITGILALAFSTNWDRKI